MQLSEILSAEGVRLVGAASSKKRLFHDLGELAETCYGLDATRVVEALLEREALGPTGVGQGIALPHARLEGLKKVSGLFLRVEKPLDFDSVDRQPVDLVFALFAPASAGVEHLKALALVSRTMRDASICAKLRANSDPSTLHAILTESETTQAA
ncbi:PTS lactose transporter subunit IIC [Loktanella sp. IMCC34160]|uniref:PTS sugar transporter subunit IIA n=1 Tax=Loktanella sp. IMCC34160 TaxID=2510646 RepID=UPI00101D79EC|nr:PTS sugar transporter subunit IIA [Loktanella sp. IMCC34160]RYG91387.1 PTS lactose transporter subunit IIC [Loktanella sp. IMCC34160]